MTYPIVWKPSPYFSKGWVTAPTNIALHSSASTLAGLLETFTSPSSTRKVSAHYTVDGFTRTIYQHVSLSDRAWHAMDANEHTVGIEHIDNGAWGVHPEITYDMSEWLLQEIAPELDLTIDDEVVGPHSRWVPTACPAALEWEQIVAEAGGDMAYVDEAQFNTWKAALQKQLETTLVQRWEGDRIVAGLRAASGAPLKASRKAGAKLVVPALPPRKGARGSAASARAGHGRGSCRDVE